MCFVVEFTYLEANLHKWKHLTSGAFGYELLCVFSVEGIFHIPQETNQIFGGILDNVSHSTSFTREEEFPSFKNVLEGFHGIVKGDIYKRRTP